MADKDPTSQSNYLDIFTEHIAFEWTIDFKAHNIKGSALHDLRSRKDGVTEVIFDTEHLNIQAVEVNGVSVQHELKERHSVMGSALHVPLPSAVGSGSTVQVKIQYETLPESIALQWLEKEQTKGKQFPFLFSQCQPIYARAVAPLQDTPSVKIKYTASVSTVLPVLLSALRVSPPVSGPPHDGRTIGKDVVVYKYRQPVPIPSYLLAIAAGNVVYKQFPTPENKPWTTGVWSEPESIDASYWEFYIDTPRFLAAEEELIQPYQFGVYDILVLPPSFPYGGMENPCITFLTPTLLTGDRKLVNVVAHEITHSFFGNGVTHAHANHFWLNEGWTTYIERLLLQVIYSPAERDFSFLLGRKGLQDDLDLYAKKPKYQRLVIDFDIGEDPDDAYSRVAYDKGSNLLLLLERSLGGLDVFLPYVKNYVRTFLGKNVTTSQWKDHLYSYFTAHGGEEKVKVLDSIDWQAWLYGEGASLPVELQYDSTLAEKSYELAARWDASRSNSDLSSLDFREDDLNDFSSTQIVVFLERLSTKYDPLPSSHVIHLGTIYKLATIHNAEIRTVFYEIAFADPTTEAAKTYAKEAATWVTGAGTGMPIGRLKFCRPVFRGIFKVDKKIALDTYAESKQLFHPIARKLMEKDLQLAS